MGFLLDGNIGSGIDITRPNLPASKNFVHQPELANKMHVVCFVVPCDQGSDPELMDRLRTLKQYATDRGANKASFQSMVVSSPLWNCTLRIWLSDLSRNFTHIMSLDLHDLQS